MLVGWQMSAINDPTNYQPQVLLLQAVRCKLRRLAPSIETFKEFSNNPDQQEGEVLAVLELQSPESDPIIIFLAYFNTVMM